MGFPGDPYGTGASNPPHDDEHPAVADLRACNEAYERLARNYERLRSTLRDIQGEVEDNADYDSDDGKHFRPANMEARVWSMAESVLGALRAGR